MDESASAGGRREAGSLERVRARKPVLGSGEGGGEVRVVEGSEDKIGSEVGVAEGVGSVGGDGGGGDEEEEEEGADGFELGRGREGEEWKGRRRGGSEWRIEEGVVRDGSGRGDGGEVEKCRIDGV